MAHPRKLIRHAVVALLTNATVAGARVQGTRVERHRPSKLPAISVFTPREPVDEDSGNSAPRELTRELEVVVRGWAQLQAAAPGGDAMDALDDLAEQIEDAMHAVRDLRELVADSVQTDTEAEFADDGDPLVGVITLTYAVTYRTTEGVTTSDDFLRAGMTTRIVGAGDNAANDVIDVRGTP